MLPNDPCLKDMTDVQIGWILMNIEHDNKMMAEASRGGSGRTMGLSDEEFEQFSKDLKQIAKQERAQVNANGS